MITEVSCLTFNNKETLVDLNFELELEHISHQASSSLSREEISRNFTSTERFSSLPVFFL